LMCDACQVSPRKKRCVCACKTVKKPMQFKGAGKRYLCCHVCCHWVSRAERAEAHRRER